MKKRSHPSATVRVTRPGLHQRRNSSNPFVFRKFPNCTSNWFWKSFGPSSLLAMGLDCQDPNHLKPRDPKQYRPRCPASVMNFKNTLLSSFIQRCVAFGEAIEVFFFLFSLVPAVRTSLFPLQSFHPPFRLITPPLCTHLHSLRPEA